MGVALCIEDVDDLLVCEVRRIQRVQRAIWSSHKTPCTHHHHLVLLLAQSMFREQSLVLNWIMPLQFFIGLLLSLILKLSPENPNHLLANQLSVIILTEPALAELCLPLLGQLGLVNLLDSDLRIKLICFDDRILGFVVGRRGHFIEVVRDPIGQRVSLGPCYRLKDCLMALSIEIEFLIVS